MSIQSPTGGIKVTGKIGGNAVSGIRSRTPASASIGKDAKTGEIEAAEVEGAATTGIDVGEGGGVDDAEVQE